MDIKPITKADAAIILDFELENRDWFEQSVPPRSEHFLTLEGMSEAVDLLLAEMKDGEGAYYLVFFGGEIAGRVNFSKTGAAEAELGYRVAKKYAGRGIATNAIQRMLPKVKDALVIDRIFAKTSFDNVASIKVLQKCGFRQTGTGTAAQLHGKTAELVRFEYLAD